VFANTSGSNLEANRNDLWNGNIGMMQTNIFVQPDANYPLQTENLGMAYKYDQLNRLVDAKGFLNYSSSQNQWGNSPTAAQAYTNSFT
jgi:hypothetical protein